jgi:phosphate acetyltransferase
LFETHVDGPALLDRLEVAHTDAVTPLMFEHQLIDRAVSDRRHIVLPEGGRSGSSALRTCCCAAEWPT